MPDTLANPVSNTEKNTLRIGKSGFSYPLITELLFENTYHEGITQTLDFNEENILHFIVYIPGHKNKTFEKYHERVVVIPYRIRAIFLKSPNGNDEKVRLVKRAKRRIQIAKKIESDILKPALFALLQEKKQSEVFPEDQIKPWIEKLDRKIDSIFFEELWNDIDLIDESQADKHWKSLICKLAYQQLQDAIKNLSRPSFQRRALTDAKRTFQHCKRKLFPALFAHNIQDQ